MCVCVCVWLEVVCKNGDRERQSEYICVRKLFKNVQSGKISENTGILNDIFNEN